MPHLKGLRVHFKNGSIVRREEGGIIVLVRPSFPLENMDDFAKAIKAEVVEFVTLDEELSTDPTKPNRYYSEKSATIERGTPVPNATALGSVNLAERTTQVEMTATVEGYIDLASRRFKGVLKAGGAPTGMAQVPLVEATIEGHLA